MVINTSRFGACEIDAEAIIEIPKGILGFEGLKRYFLFDPPDNFPFRWLQSVDDPAVAFPVINPTIFFPNYRIEVDYREVGDLKIEDIKQVHTYGIVTIPHDLRLISVNLQGPIVINTAKKVGKQLVLSKSPYCTRHFIFEELRRQYHFPQRSQLNSLVTH